jgi:glycerophosphoryl diester phosphodiesterase
VVAVLLGVAAGAAHPPAAAAPSVRADGPLIIAHRGGTGDFPENTILAINNAVQAGVDGLWLTVQASRDQVAMLYRPTDLSSLTNGAGPVNSKTAFELQQLNAGFNFAGVDGYPYRENAIGIPTLEQAVSVVPADMPLFLDLKQQPAQPVVSAVVDVLRRTGSTARTVVYSTDAGITDLAVQQADLNVAESRDLTRERLLNMALVHRCEPAPSRGIWAGFELYREVTVTEAFTLGTGVSKVDAELWDPASVECFTSQPGSRVMGFAVNTCDDYRFAAKIGLDAVLVDSPRAARQWRQG